MEALRSSRILALDAVMQPTLFSPVVDETVLSNSASLRLARRSCMNAVSEGDNSHKAGRHTTEMFASSSMHTCISFSFGASATRSGYCPVQTRHRTMNSCVCKLNSLNQAWPPDREGAEQSCKDKSTNYGAMRRGLDITPDAVEQRNRAVGDATNAQTQSSFINLSFESSRSKVDRFLLISPPPLDEEFYATIMSLNASHNSGLKTNNFRACTTSKAVLYNEARVGTALNGDCDVSEQSLDHGDDACGGFITSTSCTQVKNTQPLQATGMCRVQLPSSINKLRRKGDNRVPAVEDQRCAIRKAFASMVFIIEAVQSHALQMRQAISAEWYVHEVLLNVHRELRSTFVWLFQTVFSCTPQLMVSIMILLANFTVFSMRENIVMTSATVTPAFLASFHSNYGSQQWSSNPNLGFETQINSMQVVKNLQCMRPQPGFEILDGGSGGKINFSSGTMAGSFDGDALLICGLPSKHLFADYSVPISHYPGLPADTVEKRIHSEFELRPRHTHQDRLNELAESSIQDLELRSAEPFQYVELEQGEIQRQDSLVVAQLESDNYSCFDRTDLVYRYALSEDPFNALLLANYAQFLYVVRHDNDRAEEYFRQAVQAEPQDSTILGRFANFLWLIRGIKSTAETAFKAAMEADPETSYSASAYTHFLWHSGEEDESGHVSA